MSKESIVPLWSDKRIADSVNGLHLVGYSELYVTVDQAVYLAKTIRDDYERQLRGWEVNDEVQNTKINLLRQQVADLEAQVAQAESVVKEMLVAMKEGGEGEWVTYGNQ
jgi:predicted  nucleic acid-binding Zn-ribbon protein